MKMLKNIIEAVKLATLYIANQRRIKNFLNDKVVVFDFDGTMTAFRYAAFGTRMLPCLDSEIYEHSKTHNIYAGAYIPQNSNDFEKFTTNGEHAARMLRTMQWLISNLPKENVYVLTRTELTLVDQKNEAILANFDIRPENILHVQDSNRKLDVLDTIHKRCGSDIYFVEDTFKTQLNAEEAMPFVHGINISEFLV